MLNRPTDRNALSIVGIYAAAALAWNLVANHLLVHWSARADLERLENLKGLLFAAGFAVVLFGLLRREFKRRDAAFKVIRELNRSHHMIAACTTAMIRAADRQTLFDELCRLAVDEGGYPLAWVGLAQDDANKTVLPAARAGKDEGYVDAARLNWSEGGRGDGPGGTAIRSGRLVIARAEDAPAIAPWGAALRARDFKFVVCLPLKENGRVIGMIALYSGRDEAADPAESALLETLGASINYALDNLARRKNEERQLARLRRLSHAVEHSPVSIIITGADGKIEYVNRKFSAITGYSPEEVLGSNPRFLKSDETPNEEYAALWKTISGGKEWHGVFHNRSKTGELFWEAASISPLKDEKGNITHYIAVKEDITAQRALEQQLRQAQKMEAVGTLAGGIAHDFNNILTVIQGHCSLLEASRLPSEGDKESVAEIQSSVDRASALTRQLLAFGRRQPLRARRVDLGEATERMCRMLQRVVRAEITLRADPPPAPLFADADPALVDQVLMNLILNARDAITGKGRILVEALPASARPPAEVAGGGARGWVMLRVSDDGCGIPAGSFSRIFEPFYTTKPTGKGSGLGLAVVDGIVRQHKGWVEIDSEPGKGTAFRVYLPRAEAAEEAPPAAAASAPRGAETLLLVEDEAPLRRLCARSLEALGYRVIEAGDGDSAADLWSRHKGEIDLLVTDLVMPGTLSGAALARRLRDEAPRLGVVYVSGRLPELSPSEGLLTENAVLLPKPFKPDELARVVRARLDREKL